MMEKLKAKWLVFWHNHVQKTFGGILVALSGADLGTAISGYESDISSLLGHKVYAATRLVAAGIIVARAVTKGSPAPPPATPPPA